jgi:UDP-GlcNAc3NAcA epimerase
MTLENVLIGECPDWVLVFGDTNSTLAAALVAAKLGFKLAHIEAGLRSFNRRMPEETNRVVVDHISDLLFAPTEIAVSNLRNEGISSDAIVLVGDVMLDAALIFGPSAEERSQILQRLAYKPGGYVLATIHRAENTDDLVRLAAIFDGLTGVCRHIPVVLPLHPRTRKLLKASAEEAFASAGGLLIEPVGYLDMVMMERNAAVIVTDSGGVQKEAFFYRIPCVTLRDETEWTELIELNWNTLVPPIEADAIRKTVVGSIGRTGIDAAPYGVGDSAKLIVAQLTTPSRP